MKACRRSMEINVVDVRALGALEVAITHTGQEPLFFQISAFQKPNFSKGFDIFKEINAYFSWLDDTNKQLLYQQYARIHNSLICVWDNRELTIHLRDLTSQLFDMLNYDVMLDWVSIKSPVIIPDGFEREYLTSVDKQTTREQTYLRSDYVELLTLSILVRAIIPIWGEFIHLAKKDVGTNYKEYEAYKLLSKSCIDNLKPIKKLQTYINHTLGSDLDNTANVLAGISSLDFPGWVLTLVVIKRLTIADISGTIPNANLITYIYKYVISKTKGISNEYPFIKNKKFSSDSGGSVEDDDQKSVFEVYKNRERLSGGDIEELEYAVRDVYSLGKEMCSRLTDDDISQALDMANILMSKQITEAQLLLLQWVIKTIINPRAVYYLSKLSVVRLLAITKLILVQRGYPYIGLLAVAYVDHDGEAIVRVGANDSRSRVPLELATELDQLFPFNKLIGGNKTGIHPVNVASKAIENLINRLMQKTWMSTDVGLYRSLFPRIIGAHIPILPDIRVMLTSMIIDLTKKEVI
jgi:hypothetical protein